jgi:hypothetical protein
MPVPGYAQPVEFGVITSFAYPLEGGAEVGTRHVAGPHHIPDSYSSLHALMQRAPVGDAVVRPRLHAATRSAPDGRIHPALQDCTLS